MNNINYNGVYNNVNCVQEEMVEEKNVDLLSMRTEELIDFAEEDGRAFNEAIYNLSVTSERKAIGVLENIFQNVGDVTWIIRRNSLMTSYMYFRKRKKYQNIFWSSLISFVITIAAGVMFQSNYEDYCYIDTVARDYTNYGKLASILFGIFLFVCIFIAFIGKSNGGVFIKKIRKEKKKILKNRRR